MPVPGTAVLFPGELTFLVSTGSLRIRNKTIASAYTHWADRAKFEDVMRVGLMSPETTRPRHIGSSPHPERYDADLRTDENAFLARPR